MCTLPSLFTHSFNINEFAKESRESFCAIIQRQSFISGSVNMNSISDSSTYNTPGYLASCVRKRSKK